MAEVVHIPDESGIQSRHDEKNEFKMDVQMGLAKPNKQIQSKYFYDERGSELFNQITRHPDYYLTQCELAILNQYKQEISAILNQEAFNLIELGPGEGIKTQILIEQFLADKSSFTYMPIDISTKYLKTLVNKFEKQIPALKLKPIHSDYFRGLEWLSSHSDRQNLVLFLGSSIGNFDMTAAHSFMRHLWHSLNHGDYVLLGFDLRKDTNLLMRAYNDDTGITTAFNLNLLERINRELGGNFNVEKFRHYATYNVYTGAMESYLVSLEEQLISIEALKKSYQFNTIEPIHVEFSYKYLTAQIESLAHATGFNIIKKFTDSNEYFMDSLWQVDK